MNRNEQMLSAPWDCRAMGNDRGIHMRRRFVLPEGYVPEKVLVPAAQGSGSHWIPQEKNVSLRKGSGEGFCRLFRLP